MEENCVVKCSVSNRNLFWTGDTRENKKDLCNLGAVGQYGYMPLGCPNGEFYKERWHWELLEISKKPYKLWSVTQRAPDTLCLSIRMASVMTDADLAETIMSRRVAARNFVSLFGEGSERKIRSCLRLHFSGCCDFRGFCCDLLWKISPQFCRSLDYSTSISNYVETLLI